jgi:DNA-binding HxlR family transcriptional regulator
MGRTADYSNQSCGVAAALEVIGDPWTILILRDAFVGRRRFEQWQEHLGVARNVLASRLKSLVQHGVLEPQVYSERPLRHEYVLTRKGKELYKVMLTLYEWGSHHLYGGEHPAVRFVHKSCGETLDIQLACGCCGETVRPRDIEIVKTHGATVGEMLAKNEAAREDAA